MGDRDTDNKSTECGLSSHSSQAPLPALVFWSLFVALHTLSVSSLSMCGRLAVPILQMKKLMSAEGWLHREFMAQLRLSLPPAPP